MNRNSLLKGVLIFLFGFVSCFILVFLVSGSSILGYSVYDITSNNYSGWIDNSKIKVYDDKIVITIKNASISSYVPSRSMGLFIHDGVYGVKVKPESEEQISIGDIVSFRKNEEIIVHRVVEKGKDSEGIYFITKGDSNNIIDGKIRFKDIESVTVMLIY